MFLNIRKCLAEITVHGFGTIVISPKKQLHVL